MDKSDMLFKLLALAFTILTLLLIICWAFKLVNLERAAIRKAQGLQEGIMGGASEPAEYSFAPILFVDPHSAGRTLLPAGLAMLEENPTMPDVVENVPYDARWVPSRAGWVYGPLTGGECA